jgi:hypothetical protein
LRIGCASADTPPATSAPISGATITGIDQQQAAESIRPRRGSEHHGMPAHRVPDAEHALQPQGFDDPAHVLTEVQPVVGRRLARARTMAGHVQREDVLARQRPHHGLPAARVKAGGVHQQDRVALAGPLVDRQRKPVHRELVPDRLLGECMVRRCGACAAALIRA